MAKRTRVFLLVAASVVIAGVATGFIAWSMGVPVFAAFGSNVPDELAYVPDNVHLVAYADVRQVMSSPFRDRLRQLQRDNPSTSDGLEARTGINFETDIDRVIAAMSPGGGNPRTDRPLIVARGRFNDVKIEGLMRDQGAQVEQYRGNRLVFIKDATSDVALVFPQAGLLLFGNGDAVRRAIDTKAGAAANITGNREFMNLVGDVDDGTAWTVAKFDALSRLPGAGEDTRIADSAVEGDAQFGRARWRGEDGVALL
jgi:hypothetical protein